MQVRHGWEGEREGEREGDGVMGRHRCFETAHTPPSAHCGPTRLWAVDMGRARGRGRGKNSRDGASWRKGVRQPHRRRPTTADDGRCRHKERPPPSAHIRFLLFLIISSVLDTPHTVQHALSPSLVLLTTGSSPLPPPPLSKARPSSSLLHFSSLLEPPGPFWKVYRLHRPTSPTLILHPSSALPVSTATRSNGINPRKDIVSVS